jgi:hypothetical protein
MPRAARRPDPSPLETDDVRTVAVGTAAWGAGLVVLVVLRLTETVRVEGWWIVMCAYGLGLGLVGVRYCQRRRTAIERDKARGVAPRD